jgi:alanine dehydrogenase
MTLLLGDADVQAVLEWRPAVAALRAAYAAAADGPRFPGRLIARGDGTFLHVPLTT